MPQSILIQVGQCGNQVGFRFWESTVKEYNAHRNNLNEEQMSYFLKCKKDMTSDKPLDECYTARAVLIDMEEGVIKDGCRGSLKNFFRSEQILTDVSGSGNNWARGNKYFSECHHDKIEDIICRETEECDKLDSFLFTFSMGGGTGSGFGTAVLEFVQTMFPHVPKLVFPVYPSDVDDVITSPYNAVLANSKLSKYADLIIPFENQALIDICTKIDKNKNKFHLRRKHGLEARSKRTKLSAISGRASVPFDDMNDLISCVISDLTSCSRLPGSLNIDINELVMNLIPFPRLKYGVPSSSPFILVPEDVKIERIFADLFAPSHALTVCDVNSSVLVSTAVLARGAVSLHELQNNLNKLATGLKFVEYSNSCYKVGLCNYAPAGRHVSVLKVANTCQIAENLSVLRDTFEKMYQKKAHLHHYVEENIEDSEFSEALTNLTEVINKYRDVKSSNEVSIEPPRLNLV